MSSCCVQSDAIAWRCMQPSGVASLPSDPRSRDIGPGCNPRFPGITHAVPRDPGSRGPSPGPGGRPPDLGGKKRGTLRGYLITLPVGTDSAHVYQALVQICPPGKMSLFLQKVFPGSRNCKKWGFRAFPDIGFLGGSVWTVTHSQIIHRQWQAKRGRFGSCFTARIYFSSTDRLSAQERELE